MLWIILMGKRKPKPRLDSAVLRAIRTNSTNLLFLSCCLLFALKWNIFDFSSVFFVQMQMVWDQKTNQLIWVILRGMLLFIDTTLTDSYWAQHWSSLSPRQVHVGSSVKCSWYFSALLFIIVRCGYFHKTWSNTRCTEQLSRGWFWLLEAAFMDRQVNLNETQSIVIL